jgi:hypothetical protein
MIVNFFLNIYIRYKIKKNFNLYFNTKNNEVKKDIILVEFNKWSSVVVAIAYVVKILREKIDAKVYAYPENEFTSLIYPRNFFNNVLWHIGKLFRTKSFGIYSAFGTDKFININTKTIDPQLLLKSKKQFSKILKSKIDNFKILNLHLENVHIGDLVYDSYLKIHRKATIDVDDKHFLIFLEKSILYFYYWHNFFRKKRVKAIVVSQSVYNSSIPIRIGIKFNCKCIVGSPFWIFSLSKKMKFYHNHYLYYKKYFSKLTSKEKINGLHIVKKRLKKYFNGEVSLPHKATYLAKSTYNKNKNSDLIFNKKDNNKIKVLICSHAFSDAPHSRGFHFYEDYYKWLIAVLEISDNTNYDWYLKLHPQNLDFADNTHDIIKNLIRTKFKKIILIDSKVSHHEIIKLGISFVLTCNGSVSAEYPYFNVASINASLSNPHLHFSFSISPKNKKYYEQILNNLDKFKSKVKIKKKEILVYYLMNDFYYSPSWLMDDWSKVMNSFTNRNDIYRETFYNYWLRNFSEITHIKTTQTLRNFIKSGDYIINFNHSNISFLEHIKKFN